MGGPGALDDREPRMIRTLQAAMAYFASVFALAFVFGTVRTLVLMAQPGWSPLWAVAVEVPVLLAASWWLCGVVLRRWPVPADLWHRGLMGGLAFVLLQLTEAALAVALLDRSLAEYLGSFHGAAAWLGLAAQVAFALVPLLRRPAASKGAST